MGDMLRYPTTGCIIEYLEGNSPQIAMVVGEAGERLRLVLPTRREVTLPKNRVLPWIGPECGQQGSREERIRLLEEHRSLREKLTEAVNVLDVWEMAQGEVSQAHAEWFAELENSAPSVDQVAAYGHALLLCKTHFRFQPPLFQVYTAEEAEKRLAEQTVRLEREALLAGGRAFFQHLWEVALGRRKLEPASEWPSSEVQERLEALLRTRMLNPYDNESESLWNQVSRGLPEAPQLPLQLLLAWEKVPPHFNAWLAASGYQTGDSWWENCVEEVSRLAAAVAREDTPEMSALSYCELPFISIDSETTKDIDDAFFIECCENGWRLTVALAFPSLVWAFGSPFDELIRERGTSLYLPEETSHMLPECLGTESYSLRAGVLRPAFLVSLLVGSDGTLGPCEPSLARVRLAANLHYVDCEQVLNSDTDCEDNPACLYRDVLTQGLAMAKARQLARIRDGAVIMERAEPHIRLEGEGLATRVVLEEEPPVSQAQLLVSECMIAASVGCAAFAALHGIPMLHRTQQMKIPPEYAGVWTAPEDTARIMRSLVPSLLECVPGPHAALGVQDYTPATSPLRRYADLVNIAQMTAVLRGGSPLFDAEALAALLGRLEVTLERVGQVQRLRPRYWKLVYFKQQGDRVWWQGVVTEENDTFVMVSLPAQAISIRAKRQLFDERIAPGSPVLVRIGKVQPLWNEIQILEANSAENCVSED